MPRISALSLAPLGLCLWLFSATAFADVVPSAPICLMPGKVGVTGHDGAKCVDKEPTNCPPGWYGVLGGECRISVCLQQGNCRDDDQVCVDAEVCLEHKVVHGRGGDDEYDDPVGILGPGARCDAPRRVEKQRVCVPPGEKPTVYVIPPGQTSAEGLPRRGGSCGACTTGNDKGAPVAMFVLGVGLVLLGAARRAGTKKLKP